MQIQISVSEKRLLGWLLTAVATVLLWNVYTATWGI